MTDSEIERIYTPTIREPETPLPLEPGSLQYPDADDLGEDENGFIKIKLEDDVVVQRISRDLYQNMQSGFRELFNNEVRACRLAKKYFPESNPHIDIHFDSQERLLEIRGIDSLGMSKWVFKNVFTVLGRSNNFDPGEVGQFGFGRAAYTTLSEQMILETKWRTPDGKTGQYAVMGKGGTGYNILPDPKMEYFGTNIRLIIRRKDDVSEDDDLDPAERDRLLNFVRYIMQCGRFCNVPTRLILKDTVNVSWNTNERVDAGIHSLNTTYESRLAEMGKKSLGNDVIEFLPVMKVDSMELAAGNVVNKDAWRSTQFSEFYLIGSPIEAKRNAYESAIPLPFDVAILNILDERKYQPTADRERLKDDAIPKIITALTPMIQKLYPFLMSSTLREYVNLAQMEKHIFNLPESETYMSDGAKRLKRALHQSIRQLNHYNTTLARLVDSDRWNKGHNLEDIVYETATEFKPHRNKKIKAIMEDAVIIREVQDELLELLREAGIQSTTEFVERNPVSLNREIIIHSTGEGTSGWGTVNRVVDKKEKTTIIELDPNVIRVPKTKSLNLRAMLDILTADYTNYSLVSDMDGFEGGVMLGDFIKKQSDKTIYTNKGTLKISELGGTAHGQILIYIYSDPTLADFYTDKAHLMVFNEKDRLFELLAYLKAKGTPYSLEKPDNLFHEGTREESNWEWISGSLDRDSELLLSMTHIYHLTDDKGIRQLFMAAEQSIRRNHDAREEIGHFRRTMTKLIKSMPTSGL